MQQERKDEIKLIENKRQNINSNNKSSRTEKRNQNDFIFNQQMDMDKITGTKHGKQHDFTNTRKDAEHPTDAKDDTPDTGRDSARTKPPIPSLMVSRIPEDETTERVSADWVEPPAEKIASARKGACRRNGLADLKAAFRQGSREELLHSQRQKGDSLSVRAVEPLCAFDESEEDEDRSQEGEEQRPRFNIGRRLSNLVATAAQSQQFFEGLGKMRERVAEETKDKEPIPIFNKRLFASHGSVVITAEARRLMARNARTRPGQDFHLFNKAELLTMRSVVDGLRLIHRGQDHVKDALSHVVTFENYSPYQYIVKRPHELQLSCYYVLRGAVQVTYDMDITETRNVFQPDIIYNHGTGEFLGLVSPDGLSDDLSPPATVYTTEPSEFLRIDRSKFHAVIEKISILQQREKLLFLSKPANVFASLPPDALEKVIPHIHKMDYPPNQTILHQGDTSEYLYFILSGRCKLSRDVFIPEIDREICFYLDAREQDDFFAEECLLKDDEGSLCHITTTSHTTCFLIQKSALEVVSKEMLLHVLESRRHYFPPDSELRDIGYRKLKWDGYKHEQVRQSLLERGCLYILSRDQPEKVRSRPPSAEYQKKENLLRFMAKGANYKPVSSRVRSATVRTSASSSSSKMALRPRTAVGGIHPNLTRPLPKHPPTLVTEKRPEVQEDGGECGDDEKKDDVPEKSDVTLTSSDEALGCTPITSSFVRMLEKNIPKGVLQKIIGNKGGDMDPRLLGRAMEDNPELGRQLRLAWEMHQQDKQDGFTKTTVLVTMRTDDIVRKAKALAEKQIHTPGDSEEEEKAAEEWDSSLYEENNSARASIAGDKFRTAYLRRKIKEVQRKREQTRADLLYRSAKPGQVPPSSERVQGKAAKKKPDKFYLDELQNKYQGLDPQEASKKVCSMGYQVLFVSRLRRRSRSMCEMRESEKQKLSASLRRTSVAMATPSAVTRFAMEHGEHSAGRCGSAETGASRRRSSGESQSRLAAGHTSIRKDAPVTLRALTMPSATSRVDGDVTSSPAYATQRRMSRDSSLPAREATSGRKHLPHPKLQVNR